MIEVLKKALEALKAVHIVGGTECVMTPNGEIYLQPAITSLSQAIADLESQEPVAWIERDMQCDDFDPDSVTCEKPTIAANGWEWVALYTHPPQRTWVGLTDKERFEIRMHSVQNMGENFQETLCKAIEAKLKRDNGYAEEKNT